MRNIIIKRTKKFGLPPGTLIHIGEKKTAKTKIKFIKYNETEFHESEPQTIEECIPLIDGSYVKWINISGIQQVDIIEKIGNHFGIDSLILEDILDTTHRPSELFR